MFLKKLPLKFNNKIFTNSVLKRQKNNFIKRYEHTKYQNSFTGKPKYFENGIASIEDRYAFKTIYPEVLDHMMEDDCFEVLPGMRLWLRNSLQKQVTYFYNYRGLGVVATYKNLEESKNLAPEKIRLAQILGWCVEFLHSYIKLQNTIKNKPNTLKKENYTNWEEHSMRVLFDRWIIKDGFFLIFKSVMQKEKHYKEIVNLFHETSMNSSLGEASNIICMNNCTQNLKFFDMNQFETNVKYKTAHDTFILPISVGLKLAEKYYLREQMEQVLHELALLYQVQDDFLKYLTGNYKGNIKCDIWEGKITWLIVTALEKASPAQYNVLKENYGKMNYRAVEYVKKIYDELRLLDAYYIYEDHLYHDIKQSILQLSDQDAQHLLLLYLNALYRRQG